MAAITDHINRALANLLAQFDNSPKLRELVSIFVAEVQVIEDVYNELLTERILSAAEGVQLDRIGKFVGLSRDDLSDSIYRVLLGAKITANRAGAQLGLGGWVNQLLTVMSTLILGLAPIIYTRHGRANYTLHFEIAPTIDDTHARRIAEFMSLMPPSGVGFAVVHGAEDTKLFDSADPNSFDAGGLARRIV